MKIKNLLSNLFHRPAFVLACLIPAASMAAIIPSDGVSLVWNPNPETDVTGYKVQIGSASGNYTTVINVVGATRTALPQVSLGSTLYLVVSAYNSAGMESPRSDELVIVANVPAPVVATSFAISSPGQGRIKWKYPKNAAIAADRFTVHASEDLVNWAPASEVLIGAPTSSDAQWLYFDFPYVANKPRMFFLVGASNAFGEIR